MELRDLAFLIKANVININKGGFLVATIHTDEKDSYAKLKEYYKEEVKEVFPEGKGEVTFVL